MEPVRIDQEDGGDDDHAARKADREEYRHDHEAPEAELGRADGVRQVEHVPREPHDERAEEEPTDHEGRCAGEECA